MLKGYELELCNQHLLLLPQKAVFWKEEEILIVSDVHTGKVGHFRKAGIAIPKLMEQEELAVLSDLIHDYKPQKLLFLGDLFHSEYNNDWNWLELWKSQFPMLEMLLIKGNHDILHPEYYNKAGFKIEDTLEIGPFLFLHEPLDKKQLVNISQHVISGHIHPGVTLRGPGRQSVNLSCFLFGTRQSILPAFGRFTGKYCKGSNEETKVFAIAGNTVVPV